MEHLAGQTASQGLTAFRPFSRRFGHSGLPFFGKELLQASEADPPAGAPRPVPRPGGSFPRGRAQRGPCRATRDRTPSRPLCAGQVTGKGCADAAGDRRVGAALSGAGQQNPRGGVPHPPGAADAQTFPSLRRPTPSGAHSGPFNPGRKSAENAHDPPPRSPPSTRRHAAHRCQPTGRETQPITTPTRPANIHRCESWRIGSATTSGGLGYAFPSTTWPLPAPGQSGTVSYPAPALFTVTLASVH